MSSQEIIEMALSLNASERFAVVEKLLESLDRPDPQLDEIWADEAERRLHAYDQGKIQTLTLDQALDNL